MSLWNELKNPKVKNLIGTAKPQPKGGAK